jgi:hypothetical protein
LQIIRDFSFKISHHFCLLVSTTATFKAKQLLGKVKVKVKIKIKIKIKVKVKVKIKVKIKVKVKVKVPIV